MKKNMIGRIAVIAAITLAVTTLAATPMVMSLTQQAFAQAATGSNSNENTATIECSSTGTGPITLLSITVCRDLVISQGVCQQAAGSSWE